jgi:heme/copper-type cytochrome/quinol oxidase subunit 1
MTQSRRALLAHVFAFPSALLLALAVAILLAPLQGPAVDVQLSDTMFVVAHLHFGVLLAACVAAISLVAYRWGRLNGAILAAWALLVVHFGAGVFLSRQTSALASSNGNEYLWVTPLDPTPGLVYLGSVLAGFLALAIGLALSFRRRRPSVAA